TLPSLIPSLTPTQTLTLSFQPVKRNSPPTRNTMILNPQSACGASGPNKRNTTLSSRLPASLSTPAMARKTTFQNTWASCKPSSPRSKLLNNPTLSSPSSLGPGSLLSLLWARSILLPHPASMVNPNPNYEPSSTLSTLKFFRPSP